MIVRAGLIAGALGLVAGIILVLSLVAPGISPGSGMADPSRRLMGAPTMGDRAHMPAGGMSGMHAEDAGPEAAPILGAREVRVAATNFRFVPGEIRLAKDAELNLTFTNPASTGVVHDLVVPGLDIHISADPGETKTIGLRELLPGRYDAYCAVPGHVEMGMRATVIVE